MKIESSIELSLEELKIWDIYVEIFLKKFDIDTISIHHKNDIYNDEEDLFLDEKSPIKYDNWGYPTITDRKIYNYRIEQRKYSNKLKAKQSSDPIAEYLKKIAQMADFMMLLRRDREGTLTSQENIKDLTK